MYAAGNSLGGMIAVALAAQHPGVVRGLVLLNRCARAVPMRSSTHTRSSTDTQRLSLPYWHVACLPCPPDRTCMPTRPYARPQHAVLGLP